MKVPTENELSIYLGREFVHGSADCYGLIRDFYMKVFQIELTNYARPENWWKLDLDLYNKYIREEGFKSVDNDMPSEWQFGDLILMSIQSRNPCHAAIYIGNGKILHHFYGRRSSIETYKGIWRNTTVSVFRHKDVVIDKDLIKMELSEDARIRSFMLLQRLRSRERGNINQSGNN